MFNVEIYFKKLWAFFVFIFLSRFILGLGWEIIRERDFVGRFRGFENEFFFNN